MRHKFLIPVHSVHLHNCLSKEFCVPTSFLSYTSDQCYTLNSSEIHSSPVTLPRQCPLSSPPAWIPAVASKPFLLFCSSENQKRSFRRKSLTKTTPCLIKILHSFLSAYKITTDAGSNLLLPSHHPPLFPPVCSLKKAAWSAFCCLTLFPTWCSQKPLTPTLSLHLSYPAPTCLSSPTR